MIFINNYKMETSNIMCQDCEQNIKHKHCLQIPNVTSTKCKSTQQCLLCTNDVSHHLSIRWHCRALEKNKLRKMADPLMSIDHWLWFKCEVCDTCAAKKIKENEIVVGYDYIDAMDCL